MNTWFVIFQFVVAGGGEPAMEHTMDSNIFGTYYSEKECKTEGLRRARSQADSGKSVYASMGQTYSAKFWCDTTPQKKSKKPA